MVSGKLDLYAKHKEEYAASSEPALITVRSARYLAIDGRGDPAGEAFAAAVAALNAVAFTLKTARKEGGRDFTVSKLEGLWWGKKRTSFLDEPRVNWHWQLLIRVPDWIQANELARAAAGLVGKGKSRSVLSVELLSLNEGQCVQILHAGPYDEESRTVAEMQKFAKLQGLAFHGRHHEIYLSDPRRVPAPKLRTILRQPVTVES